MAVINIREIRVFLLNAFRQWHIRHCRWVLLGQHCVTQSTAGFVRVDFLAEAGLDENYRMVLH